MFSELIEYFTPKPTITIKELSNEFLEESPKPLLENEMGGLSKSMEIEEVPNIELSMESEPPKGLINYIKNLYEEDPLKFGNFANYLSDAIKNNRPYKAVVRHLKDTYKLSKHRAENVLDAILLLIPITATGAITTGLIIDGINKYKSK